MDEFFLGGIAALLAGLMFGVVVQRTHFCTMGAISDLVLFGDARRMRAWLLAIAVAMLCSQLLDHAGLVDLGDSRYRAGDVLWLGAIIGGLMFGFGMTQTGGCVSRNIVRLGAGNLKSLVVLLVMAVTASMTMGGLFALARLRLNVIGAIDSMDQGAPSLLGLDSSGALFLAAAISASITVFCFKDGRFRASGKDVIAGLMLGILIPIGWLISSVFGANGSEPAPPASFAFVAPVAQGLIYLMTLPAEAMGFGITAVGGVLAGGFLAACWNGDRRIEGFSDLDDLVRHLTGAVLMGIGGVLGLGCTIGQGMSGLSTLAVGSMLTTLSIMAGGVLGVRYLERGSLAGALLAALPRMGSQRPGG